MLCYNQQLPETKNRTFEEIAALFRPIQFAPSGASDFAGYGCNMASLGLSQDPPPMTPGSLATPHLDNSLRPVDKFCFDATSTGNYLNKQGVGSSGAICNEGCPAQDFHRGSQGNLLHHQIPHTSCTSIAQNLSTNDQQPLIVDAQNDRYYKNFHEFNNVNRCCLETTSFMAGPQKDCICCEHNMISHINNNNNHSNISINKAGCLASAGQRISSQYPLAKNHDIDDEPDSICNVQALKSRTLTRIYKPLNDTEHYSKTLTNNSTDNFYISHEHSRSKSRL